MTQAPEPQRSHSTTSLARFYHGANGNNQDGEEEMADPRLDFCNAFWGQGDRGYEVIMARLRGAARTVDELRAFWKERAAIEDEYAKRLNKLAKFSLGRDEIGDLAASLRNVLAETGQQASYHQTLSNELKQSVEQPTAEFGVRLGNLKRGLQGNVEKAYRNKGLQEGHVTKAKERYESDCLKLNSYAANSQLMQGRELEKLQSKLERVRQTIGANEQDFRQFVRVLEGTAGKWEQEWKAFCDQVQDMEEDRLTMTKDIIWAYANAVSQVCVEDDSSCERVREKLEGFEPQNDMLAFVRGWGTGESIPNPPRFINYSAGESQPPQPQTHTADFRRISSKPPMSASRPTQELEEEAEQDLKQDGSSQPPVTNGHSASMNGWTGSPQDGIVSETPAPMTAVSSSPQQGTPKQPFGGVAMPGMAAVGNVFAQPQALPQRLNSMAPPPVPPTMSMPEPRISSRSGQVATSDINDEEDPMAKALADLRRDPPPPGSVRRNASHRRPESAFSPNGSARGSIQGHDMQPSSSPAANTNRMSFQQPQMQSLPSAPSRSSIDMTLSPPAGGHTAAALAKSMDDFQRQSTRGSEQRQSVNYSDYAEDVVGAHPTSRPASPAGGPRAPSPAMMQPPRQPPSPVADEVLSQYHQAFPGERTRSRAGSVVSSRSRANSTTAALPSASHPPTAPPSSAPREAFAGIGAGGARSPSPRPPQFRSPSPSPVVTQGSLGPQNIGISLDEKGGVAHDSMAEAYRRQYQQQQGQNPPPHQPSYDQYMNNQPQQQFSGRRQSQYGQQPGPQSPSSTSYSGRPMSAIGGPAQSQQQPPFGQQPQQQQYGGKVSQQQYQQYPTQPQTQQQQQPSPQQQQQQQSFPSYSQQSQQSQLPQQHQRLSYQPQPSPMSSQAGYASSATNSYQSPPQQRQMYGGPQTQSYTAQQQSQYAGAPNSVSSQYARGPSPAPNQYARTTSPAPYQQNSYNRAPSPAPQQPSHQQQNFGYSSSMPDSQQIQRSPSPQPGVPPSNAAPTGQWATNGLPVLFYVKALYDYSALSGAEFDFQAGDIIAVTSTPEDGWWSGELLDEARRIPGRNDFPSNFVCLF